MDTTYNPWPVVLQGQQAARNLYDSEEEARKQSELLALRKAAGALGNQNYFAGYEGIPGAERPAALKEMWATGDPEEAAKLEALYSAPFKTQRGVETAGKIEAAKKASDLEYNKNMMREFFNTEGGQQANAFGTAMAGASPTTPGVEAPTSPNVGEPSALRPSPMLSATEKSFEVGPQGPKFGLKRMSPFEQSMKLSEGEDRRAKESRETVQGVHDNIRKTIDQIKATQQAMQTRDMPWEVGQQQIQQLQGDLQSFSQQRDVLLKRAAPSVSAIPAPVSPPGALSNRPSSEGVPRFTEKEQGAMNVKDRDEKITAANLEIKNARLGVEKVTKFLPQIKELHRLVTTQNIGHPELEAIPGSSTALSMNRANAQVKKLNEAIINMFAEPGQSQMMNTIVERQMQGAVVPGLFTEPQLNKVNSSILMSNVEHLRQFPSFLERWQQQHGDTLTGAAEAWMDYTDHNPRYGYTKDARGNVTVKENTNVVAPETWQSLRDRKMVRSIGAQTFVKQKDGSWLEK